MGSRPRKRENEHEKGSDAATNVQEGPTRTDMLRTLAGNSQRVSVRHVPDDGTVHHSGATLPVSSLTTVADSLPGEGIMAVMLGVVITIGSLGGTMVLLI
jgi:flagellar motor component MotA